MSQLPTRNSQADAKTERAALRRRAQEIQLQRRAEAERARQEYERQERVEAAFRTLSDAIGDFCRERNHPWFSGRKPNLDPYWAPLTKHLLNVCKSLIETESVTRLRQLDRDELLRRYGREYDPEQASLTLAYTFLLVDEGLAAVPTGAVDTIQQMLREVGDNPTLGLVWDWLRILPRAFVERNARSAIAPIESTRTSPPSDHSTIHPDFSDLDRGERAMIVLLEALYGRRMTRRPFPRRWPVG
jgi:hypothetical protein